MKPCEEVYLSCLAAWNFYQQVNVNNVANEFLFDQPRVRDIFVQSLKLMREITGFLDLLCSDGHRFQYAFQQLEAEMFNIFAKDHVL